jgi:hypothetical protein
MLVCKPPWVRHYGEKNRLVAINSADVHPDGTRFATAGGDAKVQLEMISS